MTDTTDIKALLGNLKFYAGEASCHPDPNYYLEFEKLCTPLNILTVVGALEAESQRADDGVKAHRVHAARLIDERGQLRERAEKAEAENEAMKSKLALKTEKLADCESALAKSEKSNAFLKEELDKLANFNPDRDRLEACQESWREVVALLKEREAELAALKADIESYIRISSELATEVESLKAKLDNPVVLSDCNFEAVSHMAHWYSEEQCEAWVAGAEHVKRQILEAGFTVKEE